MIWSTSGAERDSIDLFFPALPPLNTTKYFGKY